MWKLMQGIALLTIGLGSTAAWAIANDSHSIVTVNQLQNVTPRGPSLEEQRTNITRVSELISAISGIEYSIQMCDENIWTHADEVPIMERAMSLMPDLLDEARLNQAIGVGLNELTNGLQRNKTIDQYCKGMVKAKLESLADGW